MQVRVVKLSDQILGPMHPRMADTTRHDLIDTWAMTITPLDRVFELRPKDDYLYRCNDTPRIELPGKPYMALRLRRGKE